jgi:hypothetical protein
MGSNGRLLDDHSHLRRGAGRRRAGTRDGRGNRLPARLAGEASGQKRSLRQIKVAEDQVAKVLDRERQTIERVYGDKVGQS